MCTSTARMDGKVVIVTGANTGIGFEVAKELSARGARVILACRDLEKGNQARKEITTLTGHEVICKHLDLSSLSSVRKFVKDILETEQRLDVLVNNAGSYGFTDRKTEDGIVEPLQINYFAPYLLTLLLLPLLKQQPSRIINTSSVIHFFGRVNLAEINKGFDDLRSYLDSKLYIILFTVELARRLKGTKVVVNALHPGIVDTKIQRNTKFTERISFKLWCWFCLRNLTEAAQTCIHLAISDECAEVSGKYFVDCRESYMSWKVKEEVAKDLFDISAKMVGYDGPLVSHDLGTE